MTRPETSLPMILWPLFWLAVVATALWTRPILPVDETRYLTVAWEMWTRGDFVVPHLNGETYSHKPPLLFWGMHLGWAVFGVNDWWPRLVAPLFGLGSLILTALTARMLWPGRDHASGLAPLLLMGGLYWALFTSMTMFDTLVTFTALLSIHGVLRAWRAETPAKAMRGFVVMGIGVGLGVLAKGPVILIHVLPVALAAPLWDTTGLIAARPGGWGRWYKGIGIATLIGAAIGLAWAIPAAILGGPEYRDAIFWGQSAGRMVESFSKQRPWWFFLALILPLLLPWSLWPAAWRAFLSLKGLGRDQGLRFCALWFFPVFVAFSLISGKQPHYILPLFPAVALVLARLLPIDQLAPDPKPTPRWFLWPPAALFVVLGLAGLLAPWLGFAGLPDWVGTLGGWWGAVPLLTGLALLWPRTAEMPATALAQVLAGAMVATVIAIHLIAAPRLAADFDLAPMARDLNGLEERGYRFAHVGKYHGMFGFLGRLRHPIATVETEAEVLDWLAANELGLVLTYRNELDPSEPAPTLTRPFRNRLIVGWEAEMVRLDPDLAGR